MKTKKIIIFSSILVIATIIMLLTMVDKKSEFPYLMVSFIFITTAILCIITGVLLFILRISLLKQLQKKYIYLFVGIANFYLAILLLIYIGIAYIKNEIILDMRSLLYLFFLFIVGGIILYDCYTTTNNLKKSIH